MTSYLQRTPNRIEGMIHLIRGCRVMLDSDLAALYGVTTKRLKEQLKRNRGRFPDDFAFELSRQEFAELKSERGDAKLAGGRRYLPWAFTEQGVVMLASILNTPLAIEASIRVVRAFLQLRELLATSKELADKLAELERRLGAHDQAIATLFKAIKQLIESPASEEKHREIGFHIKEQARRYTVGNGA